MNLLPLREWYRAHAPEVQMNTTRWEGALSRHEPDDLVLAVELLERELPDGNLPTPALVNRLLAEVQTARVQVADRAAAARGLEAFRADRAEGFARWKRTEGAA